MVKERKSRKSNIEIQPIDEEMPLTNGKEHVNGKHVNGVKHNEEDKRPLGEREKAFKTPRKQSPASGSLCVLLTQGIMANDAPKVDSVLQNTQPEIINSTLRDIQPMHVLPLLKNIESRLKTRSANDIRPIIRWAQVALSVHMPYLCSLPNLEKEISGLLGWLRSRIGHQRELLALHGKISSIADQIKRRTNKVVIVQQPLVVFNNDLDSDEEFDTIGSDEDGESSEDDWWDDNELKGDEEDGEEEEEDDENDEDEDIQSSDNEQNDDNDSGSEDVSDEGEEEEDMEVG
ncbi:unnamed protein product [Caenorhabditis angaria]|uniref:Small-subunit processome Utp12 domain-containing protein n=1 Tax=Caenorhabditis angaria TaxID=860376 RepID=A0A9P1ITX8_9PELO|nr:unnamed protein product [Caenorhabditis angaria]